MKVSPITTNSYIPATSNVCEATRKADLKNKAIVGATSLAGAVLPVFAISKAAKGKFSFDIFDTGSSLKNLARVLMVSAGGILGGLAGGVATAKGKDERNLKEKEALFQFNKIAIPTAITTGVLGAFKKGKVQGKLPNIISPIVGIGLGMPLAQKVSEKLSRKVFHEDEKAMPERKIKLKDYFVHIDDIFSLAVVAELPFAKAIQADKILPVIYAWCGFETGTKNKDENEA